MNNDQIGPLTTDLKTAYEQREITMEINPAPETEVALVPVATVVSGFTQDQAGKDTGSDVINVSKVPQVSTAKNQHQNDTVTPCNKNKILFSDRDEIQRQWLRIPSLQNISQGFNLLQVRQ